MSTEKIEERLKAERSFGQWKIMSTGENGVNGNKDEWQELKETIKI